MRRAVLALAAAALVIGAAPALGSALDPRLAGDGWRILPFGDKPPTRFRTDADGAIEVAAGGGAAFLYRPVAVGEGTSLRLIWRWRVDRAPPPSDPAAAGRDDRPLAVHVFFAVDAARTGFFAGLWREVRARVLGAPFAGRLITYMWGGTAPAGTRLANPHVPADGGIVVLRDGGGPLGKWRDEAVDLAADYRAAFGEPAPPPAFIAVSADADDLGGQNLGRITDLAFAPRIANGGG